MSDCRPFLIHRQFQDRMSHNHQTTSISRVSVHHPVGMEHRPRPGFLREQITQTYTRHSSDPFAPVTHCGTHISIHAYTQTRETFEKTCKHPAKTHTHSACRPSCPAHLHALTLLTTHRLHIYLLLPLNSVTACIHNAVLFTLGSVCLDRILVLFHSCSLYYHRSLSLSFFANLEDAGIILIRILETERTIRRSCLLAKTQDVSWTKPNNN